MTHLPAVSAVAPGFDVSDGGAPRICPYIPEGATPWGADKVVRSGYELFLLGASIDSDLNCLGHRPSSGGAYVWSSYGETALSVLALARGMREDLGLQIGSRVGISGKNCPNWLHVQFATSAIGACLVPLYPSLGAGAVEYVCNHAELSVAFVSEENVESFLEIWPKIPTLKSIVIFGRCGIAELENMAGFESVCEKYGRDRVRSFGHVVDVGRSVDAPLDYVPTAEDLFIIMYTSGTTGKPKGVMLQNRAFVAAVAAGRMFNDHWVKAFGPGDVFFSFLPLAHIMEQQQEAIFISAGASVAYYTGNIKALLSDIEAANPTLFAGVPRVYARFEEKIRAALEESSMIKKMLFDYAYQSQLHNVQNGLARNWLWDKLIFDKIKAKIMPSLRIAVSGGAPMSADTNDFLKVCLNVPLVQGYGLTETTAGVLCSAPLQSRSGSCGGVFPQCEIKLVDVPDMEYSAKDSPRPRGEVYIRGASVMTGYYKNPEATSEAFPNSDGWFASGDIGAWNEDGTLAIIDRRKNLFKLAQGEYVSPETLEQEFAKAKFVSQIFVYGNSLEASLVAVIVPDVQQAKIWGEQNRKLYNLEDIVKVPAFKEEVLRQVEEIRVRCKFHKYEAIRDVVLVSSDINDLGQGFHVGNNLMTPTFKLRRAQISRAYKDRLEKLYEAMREEK